MCLCFILDFNFQGTQNNLVTSHTWLILSVADTCNVDPDNQTFTKYIHWQNTHQPHHFEFLHFEFWLFPCFHYQVGVMIKYSCGMIVSLDHVGQCVDSLAPGRSEYDFKNVIFNLVLLIGIFRSSHNNALRWMPQDLTDGKSTLVQVMAWCRQAPSHYLNQCWPRSPTPYGITRPLGDVAVILHYQFPNSYIKDIYL